MQPNCQDPAFYLRWSHMKALLIQPPIEDFYLTPHRLAALGLKALIPSLEEAHWDWKILNYPIQDPRGRAKPMPEELAYLDPFLVRGEGGPVSWFRGWRRFGPEPPDIAAEAARAKPDLILISCFAWAYARETLDLFEPLKETCPDAVLAAGGAGATVMPAAFLKAGADLVIRGEGEASLPALLEALKGRRPLGSVPNIVFPGQPAVPGPPIPPEGPLVPVIGEIPGRIDRKDTLNRNDRFRQFSASITRGCPRGCRFCSNSLCHGAVFRSSPAGGAVQALELELERQNSGKPDCWHVNFEDDNLLMDRRGFLDTLTLFQSRGGDFTFSAENGMDYSLLSPQLIRNLHARGLTQLNLSLAVLEASRAREQNRFLKPGLYQQAVNTAAEINLPVITYFIAGLPGDTPESMVETLAALIAVPTLTGISLFYPVPGLPDIPGAEYFSTVSPRLCCGSAAWPWGGGLSTEQMVTTFRLARFTNLLRGPRGLKSGVPVPGSNPGFIPGSFPGFIPGSIPGAAELKDRILETRRLHTLVKENRKWRIAPVPRQDTHMVEAFCGMIE